jgi:hypothetical protein
MHIYVSYDTANNNRPFVMAKDVEAYEVKINKETTCENQTSWRRTRFHGISYRFDRLTP